MNGDGDLGGRHVQNEIAFSLEEAPCGSTGLFTEPSSEPQWSESENFTKIFHCDDWIKERQK
jgi:hypothetical protein